MIGLKRDFVEVFQVKDCDVAQVHTEKRKVNEDGVSRASVESLEVSFLCF